LYLQAVFEPEKSVHYFIELKYAKARATNKAIGKLGQEGIEAVRTYLSSDTAKTIPNLQAYVLMFRKDRCVRKCKYC
jgi:hypothetical protein